MTCGEWSMASEDTAGRAVVIVIFEQNTKRAIYELIEKC